MLFEYLKSTYKSFLIFKKQKRLKNRDFSLISNNCCGGIIYHDLGLRFLSPTINLFIKLNEYLLFLENFNECLAADIIDAGGVEYPVGKIILKSGETVELHFMHYRTFEEAKNKFVERSKRINRDNLFVFLEAGIETTDDIVERFDALPFKNKVIITNKEYPDISDSLFIDIYGEDYKYGKMVVKIPGTFKSMRYLDLFDYIKWLNTGEITRVKKYNRLVKR